MARIPSHTSLASHTTHQASHLLANDYVDFVFSPHPYGRPTWVRLRYIMYETLTCDVTPEYFSDYLLHQIAEYTSELITYNLYTVQIYN